MFDRIIRLGIRNPVFVNLLFLLVCGAGIAGWMGLPSEQFPEVSLDRVSIDVFYPGATAADVEELVVRPIEEALEERPPDLQRTRVFAGVAGWGPEQLEDELDRDDWIIEPADADAIFTDDPDRLWSEVLRRKGGRYELVSRMPLDPSLN